MVGPGAALPRRTAIALACRLPRLQPDLLEESVMLRHSPAPPPAAPRHPPPFPSRSARLAATLALLAAAAAAQGVSKGPALGTAAVVGTRDLATGQVQQLL